MKNQKGITLIALVITIIVLLILAAVSISAIMGEDGITNRAQDAKNKSAIATEKEQLNLSYSACKMENIETEEDGMEAPVAPEKLEEEMNRSYGANTVSVSGTESGLIVKYLDSQRTYMIMQSGKMIIDVSAELKKNDPIGIAEDGNMVDMSKWMYEPVDDGYGLNAYIGSGYTNAYIGNIVDGRIEGKMPAYILENPSKFGDGSPEGEFLPVVNINGTFAGLQDLVYPPEIPNTVTGNFSMYQTFLNCTSLKVTPKIPNTVTELVYTFQGCRSLETVTEIPNSVTKLYNTFGGCESLKNVCRIPDSVIEMALTFEGCRSLTGTMIIDANIDPTNIYRYDRCFLGAARNEGCNLVLTGSCSNLQTLLNTKSADSNIVIGD